MVRTSLYALVALLGTAAAAACGDPPPANNPETTATATTTGTTTETAPTASAPPTATTPPAPTFKGPGLTKSPYGGNAAKASKAGVKLAGAAKPEDDALLRSKLDAAVEKEGEGMQFDAGPVAARAAKAGEVLELPITLQPNKCYTAVAVSADGITELDMSFIVTGAPVALPIPVPAQAVATDTTTGPDALIGGGTNCYKNSLPVPGNGVVQVKATKGAGAMAVQVLVK